MKQELIDYLITTEKRIKGSVNSTFKELNKNKRLILEAETIDTKYSFKLIFSQSLTFSEKFSVVLQFIPNEDDDINLVRYNGTHPHYNKHTDGKSFNSFHKHFATEKAITLGIKPEYHAKEANYVKFDGAILKFFTELNFINYKNYLRIFNITEKDSAQEDLFDN